MTGYFELSFELGALPLPAAAPAAQQPQIAQIAEIAEAACLASGALAVTLSDARDQPVFEPRPGEMPLWQATRVQALFAAERAGAALIVELAARLGVEPAQLAARAVPERLWEREWLRDFHAMRFGEHLWICPHHEAVAEPGAVVVRLDPGLAFGTGTHPSTALCLTWLDRQASFGAGGALDGCRLVDYGCGSGVLALAALKLGARRAYAFDIDPQALRATRENALDNGVADRLRLCERSEDVPRDCDVLVANILGTVLLSLRHELAALLPAGGRLLLAGILAAEQSEMAAAFAKWFDMKWSAQRDDWVALSGTRY
ncbi:MAG TPA: 50S ribosomal protein L11 methyltransferase [Steroidobacteraceae bacterium]|nr:50S ribosomal protein L11 methyltransferase [Steroidobacteraceae bacterium]